MLKISSSGKSDIGLKRSNNEDSFIIKSEPGLLIVSDGMGGAAAGEIASQTFTATATEVFSVASKISDNDPLELVKDAFLTANDRIIKMVGKNPQYKGMGCTAELLTFTDHGYVLGHVGDSRTYLYRNNHLNQITKDHSLVQSQLDEGLITPEEARNHSLRHMISRAVGIDSTLAVDLIKGDVHPGDIMLLCSDGLTDMVDDSLIGDTLSEQLNLSHKVNRLIELAKSAGGKDNITVILCEITN